MGSSCNRWSLHAHVVFTGSVYKRAQGGNWELEEEERGGNGATVLTLVISDLICHVASLYVRHGRYFHCLTTGDVSTYLDAENQSQIIAAEVCKDKCGVFSCETDTQLHISASLWTFWKCYNVLAGKTRLRNLQFQATACTTVFHTPLFGLHMWAGVQHESSRENLMLSTMILRQKALSTFPQGSKVRCIFTIQKINGSDFHATCSSGPSLPAAT